MEKLSDKKILNLWAKHYPQRLNATESRTLCMAICGMVEDCASAIEDSRIGWWDKVVQALSQMGIPISQYDQVKSEQKK